MERISEATVQEPSCQMLERADLLLEATQMKVENTKDIDTFHLEHGRVLTISSITTKMTLTSLAI